MKEFFYELRDSLKYILHHARKVGHSPITNIFAKKYAQFFPTTRRQYTLAVGCSHMDTSPSLAQLNDLRGWEGWGMDLERRLLVMPNEGGAGGGGAPKRGGAPGGGGGHPGGGGGGGGGQPKESRGGGGGGGGKPPIIGGGGGATGAPGGAGAGGNGTFPPFQTPDTKQFNSNSKETFAIFEI